MAQLIGFWLLSLIFNVVITAMSMIDYGLKEAVITVVFMQVLITICMAAACLLAM